jgi:large conductance mechanosensitive channel
MWKEFRDFVTKGNLVQIGVAFINALINFLVVKAAKIEKPKLAAAPTTKACPYCKTDIRIDAVRCPHCTAELPSV